LQEAFLWQTDGEVEERLATAEQREQVSDEIADVLIFSLLFCHATGIDPLEAIGTKLSKNAKKYPVARSKGNATKYTDL